MASSSSSYPSFKSKLFLVLTSIPLCISFFAFTLQWRGEINVDHLYLPPPDHTPVVREAESRNSVSVSSSFRSTSTDCMDVFRSSSSSLFPLHDGWTGGNDLVSNPKICITTTTSADLEQLLQWIFYHKVIGVSSFFIFVEETAAKKSTSSVLEAIPGVRVIYRTKDLVKKQAASRIWNETWFSEFLYKPCNYQSFLSQSLNMETATVMARDAGINWIIHLDTDELIHPAGSYEYSLMQMLLDVPSNIDMLVFPTYESSIQRDDIVEPFTEVSLFKRSYDHLPRDMFYGFRKEASHGNSDYFLTYANGKSAVRIQDRLIPNGPYRWKNYQKALKPSVIPNGKSAVRIQDHLIPNGPYRWQDYLKALNEIKLEEGAILHYTYTKLSDLTSKRDKCSCKPNREDAKRCFMLNFDRDAFIVASTATEKEKLRWFHEHVVWKDKELIVKLLKNNIMTHITAPMAIIKALRDSGVFTAAVESANIASNSKISN